MVLWLCSLLPKYSTAQPLFHLRYQEIGEVDDLKPANQYFIFQDSRDYIWISTDDGLQRYDGNQLITYQKTTDGVNTLAENKITSPCFEDSAGNLWFSTSKYLNCFRYNTSDFMAYSLPAQEVNAYRLFHQDQDGELWVQAGTGKTGALWKFNPDEAIFTPSIPLPGGQPQLSGFGSPKNAVIISTDLPGQTGMMVTSLSGEAHVVEFISRSDGSQREFPSDTYGAYLDADGNFWTGLYDGLGRWELGQEQGIVVDDRLEDIGGFEYVRAIIPYQDNYLLVAADDAFLLFDLRRQMFVHRFEKKEPLPHAFNVVKEPNCFYQDNGGNTWIGGRQRQIVSVNLDRQRFLVKPDLVAQSVNAMAQDSEGKIWISTKEKEKGTYVYGIDGELLLQTQEFKNVYTPNELPPLPPINFFLQTLNHDWWGNLDNSFLRWNASEQIFLFEEGYDFYDPSLSTPEVSYCFERSNGNFLAAIGSEIHKLVLEQQGVDTVPWYNLEYLQLATINFIYEDQQKRLYIGDEMGRLLVFKEQNEQLVKLADYRDVGPVYAIHENNTAYWIASAKGLIRLNPHALEYKILALDQDGVPTEPYYTIFEDQKGYLWLPGDKGLIRFHPESKNHHRFGLQDGLLSAAFNANCSIDVTETGEIWLGGNNGVNVFHPDSIVLSDVVPKVHFSRFLVNDITHPWNDSINRLDNMTLDYEDNTVSFEFEALDFSTADGNQYFYQLEGVDEEQVSSGRRKFVRYANLPANTYTFNVWASNVDGVLNPEAKSLTFTITPPFYQRGWFRFLVVLVISGIVYGVFRYRLEQALKVERLRVKISSDLHDDVGGMLSGLAMQSELLEMTATDEAKPKLARIAEISRTAMSRMRDTVWAIDARKDQLKNLIDRMREHAEETLEARGIQYSISTTDLDLEYKLATDVRQNLYLIYKEAITNVAKHSNGDTVNIILEQNAQQFLFSIHDNGQVETKDYITTGLGQSNMRMRAEAINASLMVDTKTGFKVEIARARL